MAEDYVQRLKLGRNDPCACGSGKKYKKCHLQADEEAMRQALAQKATEAAAKAQAEAREKEDKTEKKEGEAGHPEGAKPKPKEAPVAHVPKAKPVGTATRQVSAPRKVGGG